MSTELIKSRQPTRSRQSRKSRQPKLQIISLPSPNFNDRKGQSIRFLILHYTVISTEATIQRFRDPTTEVSAHYLVGLAAEIYGFVDEANRAWHVGTSYWDGATDLNSSSIGIEIVNDGFSPFPEAQMRAVIALSKGIVKRYKIRAVYIIGHSDAAPVRKQDPGVFFDWELLRKNRLGVMAQPTAGDYKKSANWTDDEVKAALVKIGYDPAFTVVQLVTEFQRHYYQKGFANASGIGVADSQTKAHIACLARRKAISDGLLKRRSRL